MRDIADSMVYSRLAREKMELTGTEIPGHKFVKNDFRQWSKHYDFFIIPSLPHRKRMQEEDRKDNPF